jgi:hypothetical protein
MTAGIAANLGMAPTREAFAAASTEELVAARTRLASMSDGGGPVSLSRRFATGLLPFGPSPDGDLLPATPIERIAAGAGAAVPVLAGNTSQEFNIAASRSAGDLDQTVLLDTLAAPGPAAGCRPRSRTAGESSTYLYEFRWLGAGHCVDLPFRLRPPGRRGSRHGRRPRSAARAGRPRGSGRPAARRARDLGGRDLTGVSGGWASR